MSRTLREAMSDHIDTVFLNTDHFATTIVYQRGTQTVSLTAMVSDSQVEVVTSFGATGYETRDYLVQPSLLVIGSAILPAEGDRIIEGGKTFVVTKPGGVREWRYEDENRLLMRIHTVFHKA